MVLPTFDCTFNALELRLLHELAGIVILIFSRWLRDPESVVRRWDLGRSNQVGLDVDLKCLVLLGHVKELVVTQNFLRSHHGSCCLQWAAPSTLNPLCVGLCRESRSVIRAHKLG